MLAAKTNTFAASVKQAKGRKGRLTFFIKSDMS